MRVTIRLLCTAALLGCLSGIVRGEMINQIPSPFATTPFLGDNISAYSMNDIGNLGANPPVPPILPGAGNFGEAFDNFTFSSDLFVNSISWVGAYDGSGGMENLVDPSLINPSFTISFYDAAPPPAAPPGFPSQPGSLLQSYTLPFGAVNEMLINPVGGEDFFYEYTAALPEFAVDGGTEYWVSIVADLALAENGWGLAYSGIGDGYSVQDFDLNGNGNLTSDERFFDSIDYAVKLNAVPEPSSLLLVLGSCVGLGLVRRRRQA